MGAISDVVPAWKSAPLSLDAPAGPSRGLRFDTGPFGQVVLRDRRKLSSDGVVVVVVAIDAHHGQLVSGPDIVNRGFVFEETSGDILEAARERVMLSLQESAQAEVVDRSVLEQNVRRVLGKYFYEVTQRKPVIVPVIVEV